MNNVSLKFDSKHTERMADRFSTPSSIIQTLDIRAPKGSKSLVTIHLYRVVKSRVFSFEIGEAVRNNMIFSTIC